MTIKIDEKTGLKFREGTGDEDVLKEMCEYKPIFEVCAGETCLELGANIGVFTYFAIKNGIKTITSFEPEPNNYELLCQQPLKGASVMLVNKAVTDIDGYTKFYVSKVKPGKKTCMGRHSIIPTRGREEITVPTTSFYKELDIWKPTIIKCDIEGGEFTIDWTKLPRYVKYLAMEIHCKGNEEKAVELKNWFEKEFDLLYEKDMKFFGKQDTFIRVGKRKS